MTTGAALACYQQALPLCRVAGYRRGEAGCLNGIGLCHQRQARFSDAVDAHRQALSMMVHEIRAITTEEADSLSSQPIPDAPDAIRRNV